MEILGKLLPVGGTVSLFGDDVALPIEHDHAAVVVFRYRVRPTGNQMIRARLSDRVDRNFHDEPTTKRLELWQP